MPSTRSGTRLDIGERARLNARQGVRYHLERGACVIDPATMLPVPRDGETMGEIMFRGNIAMKGYLKNPKATQEAFAGGWFHTGDLAVMYPDGYMKIKDRSKDIIISGGENISSIEVEDVLYRHPAVLAAAVVAKPDRALGRDAVCLRRTQAGRAGDRPRLSAIASGTWPASRCHAPSCSETCPRRPPARFRSSNCVAKPVLRRPSTSNRVARPRAQRQSVSGRQGREDGDDGQHVLIGELGHGGLHQRAGRSGARTVFEVVQLAH